MTVSAHTSKTGVTGAVQAGSVSITDTDACQDEVVTITLANGVVLTATESTVATSTDTNTMTFLANTGTSGSKRIAAALSLANALNANSNLTASADTYAVTITEVYGGTGGSIVSGDGMTEVDWSGGVDFTVRHDGGLILNAGTPDATQSHMNSPTTAKSLKEIVAGRKVVGSKVRLSTGSAHKSGVRAATTASNNIFAYSPNRPDITRSITDTGFVIKQGVVNKIAGTALNPILIGSRKESLATGSVHVPNGIHKYWQTGTWATSMFNIFRDPTSGSTDNSGLLQSDGSPKAGITSRGSTVSLATDHAAFGHVSSARATGASELIFLIDFATTPWTGGGNFQDYSAITG